MPTEVKWAISFAVAAGLVFAGWKYVPLLVTLHIMVCVLLVIVIMLQSGSAADLAGAFGGAGSQTAFGPRGAATFLSRATTWCAIVFMVTSLALSLKRSPEGSTGYKSIFDETLVQKSAPAPAKPVLPAPPPQSAPPTTAPSSQPPPSGPAQKPAPKN